MNALLLLLALLPAQHRLDLQELKIGQSGPINPHNGRLEVERIIDSNAMIVRRVVRSEQVPLRVVGRSVIIRGIDTKEYADESRFADERNLKVTGTQRLADGRTLFVLEPQR
jgi:hypothetical protein